MSKKRKRERFAENETFPNLFQQSYEQITQEPFLFRGKWKEFFGNHHPIVIELGCGKGEYTVGLARENPAINFIGIDIKGARLWHGCKTSQIEQLANTAFIRARIQLIHHFFAPEEVDEIWITFPDPQPRISKEKKRLTSPEFLERYRSILKPNGLIHLKTDSSSLYHYTLDVIHQQQLPLLFSSPDIYQSGFDGMATRISTYYEQIWLKQGLTIKYLQYTLPPDHD
jgi:tRNA (guanine-N7-)-methyltransferase